VGVYMKKLPDRLDTERASLACDRLLQFMRHRDLPTEVVEACGEICRFVHQVKKDVEWLESLVHLVQILELDEAREKLLETTRRKETG
jgi:enoyl-[acyl-carrier-protein] reductase (NADH)